MAHFRSDPQKYPFGAYFGLWIARHSSNSYVNNIFAQIGLIMLIGLAQVSVPLPLPQFAPMAVTFSGALRHDRDEIARIRVASDGDRDLAAHGRAGGVEHLRAQVARAEGRDVFDDGISYNPFLLSERRGP